VRPVDAIAAIVALCDGHEAPEVREAGRRIAADPTISVIEALGFDNSSGVSARLAVNLPERDRILRELAPPGSSRRQAATQVTEAVNRYRATQWKATRIALSDPHPAGSKKSACWRVLKMRDRDLTVGNVRKVLAG
jgi:hypothetical protein